MGKQYNPKFSVDLKNVFNKTYSNRTKEFRDKIRPLITNSSFKKVYGQALVQTIVDRTLSGEDKNGKPFIAYKKSYIKSEQFEIWGKSAGEVNLELTGSMLADIEVKSQSGTKIELSFSQPNNRNKAQGHISGKLGKTTGRKRDFFGASEKELSEIMEDVVKLQRSTDLSAVLDLIDSGADFESAVDEAGEDDGE